MAGPTDDHKIAGPPQGEPPGSWWPVRRFARRALAPVERFLAIEAASGLLLLAAAAIALFWANSPWRESYSALWHLPFGVSWIATRFGIARLPRGVTWSQVGIVGFAAGIGFTMSIFIAALAFPAGTSLETSKFGILIGSGVAAVLAYGLGRIVLPSSLPSEAAETAA